MNKQIFKCYIKTLSPIHIGCDEVYEPAGFVMDEQNRQIIVFNPVDFITDLSDEDKITFNDICSKGSISSILELYKFLRNKPAEGRKVDICKGFVDHYNKILGMNVFDRKIQWELKNFSVPRTSFLQIDQRPYIPGSSIKGSLRTAYLNFLENKKQVAKKQGYFKKGRFLEEKLMDFHGIQEDPFRLVKISDFMPVDDVKTKIVYGINQKKKITDTRPMALPSLFEVILPGGIFTGIISVETPEKNAGIKNPVNLENLLQAVLKFYSSEKKREDRELNVVGISNLLDYDEGTVLFRCGRHSGAESITIKGHRSIKIIGKRGERPKYKPHATTLWLASEVKTPKYEKNLYPFGWAVLDKIDDSFKNKFFLKEQDYQNRLKLEKQQRFKAAEKKQKLESERVEAEKKKAKEAELKRLALEKRKAELKKMSPEQRLLAEFDDPDLKENRVVEIFNKLDDISDEWQKQIAVALKKYWIANEKWKQKKVSKKQILKIKKIKKIIGDD